MNSLSVTIQMKAIKLYFPVVQFIPLYKVVERFLGYVDEIRLSGKRGVRSAECGVWKMKSVENAECRKCGVWKMRSVENAECRKCGVWKMRSVKEKYIKRL